MEGAAKAVKRTAHELANNEDLHKGVEFGGRAAWEVTKEVGKRTGQEVIESIGEKRLVGAAKKTKRLSRIAKAIDESPGLASGRAATEIAAELSDALEEYPELAKQLGIRIKTIKSEVYK